MTRTMKDSGVEWIGQIPEKWNVKPIYTAFSEVVNKNYTGKVKTALRFSFGTIIPKENFNSDEDDYVADTIKNYTIVEPGNIIINGLNLNYDFVTKRVAIVNDFGVITSAYISIKPDINEAYPKFMLYLLKSYDHCRAFHGMGEGVRKILNYSELKKNKVILPPLPEQQAIADYLDDKCAQIDNITATINEQIEVLKQYKKSVITEAVTKGLNPNVPMKDSGVEWIGQIPEHWEVIKGKYRLKLLNRPVKENDEVITCFRDGEVTLRSKRREDGFTISLQETGYQGINPGDLVVHGMDGFAGAIGISDSRGKATPVLNVLDTKENKKFFMYYLRTLAFTEVFIALSTGIRVRSCDTNWNKLRQLVYLIPPLSEQQAIADYLDDKCAKIDAVIADKQAQLETLAAYKKSLIYECVTGKKSVPGFEEA